MPKLKDYRQGLGLTQKEVADRISVSQAAYSDIESGKTHMPNPDVRREICRVLRIGHLDLLVAIGQLEDRELPGFGADTPQRDPDLERRVALLEGIDFVRDSRGDTLDVVLLHWAEQDRAASQPTSPRKETR